jgi:hypothetical protein
MGVVPWLLVCVERGKCRHINNQMSSVLCFQQPKVAVTKPGTVLEAISPGHNLAGAKMA